MAEATRTVSVERGGDGASTPAPQLLVVVTGDHPLTAPSRHRLDHVDVVTVGRGAERATRREVKSVRKVELGLQDRAVSTAHLQLTRVHGAWIAEDLGSKNGVVIGGVTTPRRRLVDGDVIQLGASVLLYRDAVPPLEGPPDLEADVLPQGRETFVASLAEAWDRMGRVAAADVAVCLIGETGTGKEVAARTLHALSRRPGPFVAVNCGAIPPTLIESTLFGHRRGSFSGAVDDQPGFVRASDGGTLFLDELAELPPSAQAALLRVLQQHEVVPVGASQPIAVDLRLCVAVFDEPGRLVERGLLRRDLAARINGLRFGLPALAERREDLGLLLRALLRRHCEDPTRVRIAAPAVAALVAHAWPDNIRELELALTTALALARGERQVVIEKAHLPAEVGVPVVVPAEIDLAPADLALRDELTSALRTHAGNVAAVARAMGKGRMQVHRWARRFGLDLATYRS